MDDASTKAWSERRRIVAAMDPETRVRIAIDLSESIREIQLAGLLARNPGWSRLEAVRHLVLTQFGVDIGYM